jgi:flagellar FliL protein
MADEPEEQAAEAVDEAEGGEGEDQPVSRLWLLILAAAVVLGAGSGFGTARLLLGFGGPPPARQDQAPAAEPQPGSEQQGQGDLAYYDFEAIVANLDEPRLARYIRATITVAIRAEDYKVATELIDKKQPELRSWLTVYLSGCTLEDVRGPKNLNRIRREIQDAFNQQLWPNARPLIEMIFFKEFAVQ